MMHAFILTLAITDNCSTKCCLIAIAESVANNFMMGITCLTADSTLMTNEMNQVKFE